MRGSFIGGSARPRIAIVLLILPLLAACGVAARTGRTVATPVAPPVQVAAPPRADLVADPALQKLLDPYPSADGPSWLGGDVASSIRLADERWVWIFGDTLLGSMSHGCAPGSSSCARSVSGAGAGMIANSAGTMVRSADGVLSPVVKYWRTAADGAPAAIFTAPGDGFLWPLAGVRVGQILLVAANRHTGASGLLPVGNLFLRVSNPDAPPDAWIYDAQPIPGFRAGGDEPLLSWTSALVAAGDFVYVFGSRDVGPKARTVVARLATRALAERDWQPALEYLQRDEQGSGRVWSSALDPERLREIAGLPGTSEAAIDSAAGIGWYTFQIPPLGYEIRLYSASDLLGPWQDRGVAYEIPEHWQATVGRCARRDDVVTTSEPDPDCAPVYAAYAPKAHPELAPPDGYAVSYNVNTWSGGLDASVRALQTQQGFYVPQLLATPP